ncbi:MAG: hypothetical protein PHC85_00400 [Candidatus Pacebacteria bacterium]|nr:hypothetical protein [Candidatus Paceibacterota bacterium]
MKQRKFTGILGIWIIVLAFLGLSSTLHAALLTITGLAIALLSFKPRGMVKSDKELIEDVEKAHEEFKKFNAKNADEDENETEQEK